MDARLRFACALAAAGVAGLAAAGSADAATVLRVDPPDGSWAADPPRTVRLWFDDASAAKAAQVRLSSPRHSSARSVRTTVAGDVVTVSLPDDGDGTYRLVWFVVDDETGEAAAGASSFRVGADLATGSDRGAGSFTIPDTSAAGTTRTTSGAKAATSTSTSASTSATSSTKSRTSAAGSAATKPNGRKAGTKTAPAAGPATKTRKAVAVPAAPAVADVADEPFDPADLVPTPPLAAAGLLAGLLAFAAGAGWSFRRGEAAGLR